jgi:RNA polymerase sigma-70 factor, ECF subfamily
VHPSPASSIDREASTASASRSEWFEQLYDSSHARIYNLAARIVGDRDDAADVTQEVFLRAFTHPPDEQGMRNPEPWLYRVTVNACYDHLRRRKTRATTPLETAGEIACIHDGFASAETTHAVEDALGRLTLRYRTALVLKDLHGLGTDEVADVMGVSRATARVLLHRSRAAFRRAFREAAPAGAGALPALGLAAFLPALAVPAALQAPPAVAALVSAAPVGLVSLPSAMTLPATGYLAKIAGALGVKGAVVVATAIVVTGGAAAAHQLTTDVREGSAARPAEATPTLSQMRPGNGAGAGGTGGPINAGGERRGQRSSMGRPGATAGDGSGGSAQGSASSSGSARQTQSGTGRSASDTGSSTGSSAGQDAPRGSGQISTAEKGMGP